MSAFGVADLPIESKMLTNSLNESQRKVCTLDWPCQLTMYSTSDSNKHEGENSNSQILAMMTRTFTISKNNSFNGNGNAVVQ